MQTKSVLLLIFVLFLACNKNDDGEPSFPNNYFIAQRADITWQGSTEIVLTASDTLIFLAVGNGLDNGVLVAKIKFDGIGSYILNDLDGIYYNTLGGDVLISQYAIEDGSNGIFSISTYEEGNRYIEGGFKMPLRATMLANPEIKDSTLTISDGHFKGFIRGEILQ